MKRMRLLKSQFCFFLLLWMSLNSSHASIDDLKKAPIPQSSLPVPENFLLSQPLMTLGVEQYYQRKPMIETIAAKRNHKKNVYFRTILMLIDADKARNNALLARRKNEAVIVELAYITMNFNALPQSMINKVLTTSVPFGKLLQRYQLKTMSQNKQFFVFFCNEMLHQQIHCKVNDKIYGRFNRLVRADNRLWVAQVFELLTGVSCKEDTCQTLKSVYFN